MQRNNQPAAVYSDNIRFYFSDGQSDKNNLLIWHMSNIFKYFSDFEVDKSARGQI